MKTINIILKIVVAFFYGSLVYMFFNLSLGWKLALVSFILLCVGVVIRMKLRNNIYLERERKTNSLARTRKLRYPTMTMAKKVEND